MREAAGPSTITIRLADAFYTEAMLLADETRSYLDGRGAAERDALNPYERVAFACESLNATTRLMQVIAWLLARKAAAERGDAGAGGDRSTLAARSTLADVEPIDGAVLTALPAEARRLIGAGIDLYDRVRRLDEVKAAPRVVASPVLALLQRLERSL